LFTILLLVEDLFQSQVLFRRLIRHFVVGFVALVQEQAVVRRAGLKLKKLATSDADTPKSLHRLGVPASAKQPWCPSMMTASEEGVLPLYVTLSDRRALLGRPAKRSSRPVEGDHIVADATSSPSQLSTSQLSALGFLLLKEVRAERGGCEAVVESE
jgi:hypothetical protein